MKKRYIISLVSFICFLIITVLLLTGHLNSFDNSIYKIIISIRNDFFDVFFKTFTYLGNTIPVMIIVITLLMLLKLKDRILLGSSVIVTLLSNQILKYSFRRPRPPVEQRLIKQGGYSYPSGHTMMALCLYGVLIYLIYTKINNKKLKWILITLCSIIILLIGISRIYVRVHYPSDVLAAIFITITILIINITTINNRFRGNGNDKNVGE